jgi:hypothetical protein
MLGTFIYKASRIGDETAVGGGTTWKVIPLYKQGMYVYGQTTIKSRWVHCYSYFECILHYAATLEVIMVLLSLL